HIGTAEPSGRVAVAGPAVRLTVWPKAATAANGRIQTTRSAAFKIAFILFVRIFLPRRQFDSSITNSLQSTSIIISIPPGKTLLVVISRSLCECHMNANPASPVGEFAIVPDGGVVPVGPVARTVAFGPRYGLPPNQAPFAKILASGRVTGPPPATSPNGAACIGLLWSWHHSK